MRPTYWPRLKDRVERWKIKHASDFTALEAECRRLLELTPDQHLRPGQQICLDALITERIRERNDWPTQEEFANRGGEP